MSDKGSRGTSTSSFGSPGRISHDSSDFYDSRMYAGRAPDEDIEYRETAIQPEMLDKLYLKSSESMEELPDYSVHLMVTSPPYNVQKEYDQDLTLEEYTGLLRRVFAEVYRVLVTGGRACVNVANLGRKPYIPLHSIIIEEMLGLGFFMRGEIIWDKAASASPSTAWGSWMSATNPVLRDVHEYILVFSKEAFRREREEAVSTIERDEFLEWTKSVWSFPAVSARQIGHPAPFPEELPRRLIELYSFQDDVVLDPFAGSGTTCVAAKRTGRHYIGYETEHEYRQLAIQRLSAVDNEQEG
ncbi:MAG: site-specific DNA-methyltransferase [Anaerolineales bacterium]